MTEELSTAQVVARTGVPEGTLRMWERRHGFPAPRRLPGGHRRYSQADVQLIRRVARDRAAGITLARAITRATEVPPIAQLSPFAALRREHPELEARSVRKPILIALTHAIEDESLARAERSLIFASFQSERFYRQSEDRWRQLSRGAELAVAFAHFPEVRTPRGGPIELPVTPDSPIGNEWTVVIWAPNHAACLAAWEPPPRRDGESHTPRSFEAVWSLEPRIVHRAATVCADIASASLGTLTDAFRAHLEADPGPPPADQLRAAAAISSRMLSYLS